MSHRTFTELEEGIGGIIHISHIVPRPTIVEKVVTLGKEYDIEVREFNVQNRRINLNLQNVPKESSRRRKKDPLLPPHQ